MPTFQELRSSGEMMGQTEVEKEASTTDRRKAYLGAEVSK